MHSRGRDGTERDPIEGVAPGLEIPAADLLRLLDAHTASVIYIRRINPPQIVFINAAYEHLWGRPRHELLNDYGAWLQTIHPLDRERIAHAMSRIWKSGEPHDLEFRIVRPSGEVRCIRNRTLIGQIGESFAVGVAEDVTDANYSRANLSAQHRVLQSIAHGRPLRETLDLFCRVIEELAPGVRASVLLLDRDGKRIEHVAAPSFHPGYAQAIQGVEVGPDVGTCGAAITLGRCVVTPDIAADPKWRNFRSLAADHQLEACWSSPVTAGDGRILGSFGLYPNQKREPNAAELELLDSAAHLAAIGIERDQDERALRDANLLLEERVRERTRQLVEVNDQLQAEAIERRAALAALAESEDRFRSVVQSIPGAVYRCLLDADWTMRFLSDGVEGLTGYPASAFLEGGDLTWASVIHPDDRDGIERMVEDAVSARKPFEMEYRLLHRDGTIRWMFEQGRAVFEGDQVLYLDGVILDVTTQHHMQEAIRESEQRFRVLADEAPMLVWMTDVEGRCEFCNRGWLEFTGRQFDDEIGDGWLQCMSPEDRERLIEAFRRHADMGGSFQFECAMRRVDGEMRIMFMRGAPRGGANGRAHHAGFIGSAIDITDLRLAQDEARRQEAELAHAPRLATVGEMATAIAHELNQPLTSVSNYATGAVRRIRNGDITTDELEGVLREIDALARRGGDVIRHVRMLVQKRTPRRGEVRLSVIIEQAWRMLEVDAAEAGVIMEFDLVPVVTPILVDAVQFEQVLVNLLRNAVEELRAAPPDERKIAVRTRLRADGGVLLEVADTGRGVQTDEIEMFSPFQSSKPHGMGLGLAISRSIIEAHGGRISYAPNEPHGAVFRIELPPQVGL